MQSLTRRYFLGSVFAAGATMFLPGAAFAAERRKFGPNDTIRLAFIGLRSRGNDLLGSFRKVPGVVVAALCDVDSMVLTKRLEEAKKLGENPKVYGDPKQVFDDSSIDAVVIATPNHTHALLSIWAMQAGKDVYVEKPVSHNVHEGRQLVKAARHYDRIVQAGTQNRSDVGLIATYGALHSGEFGKVKAVHGICYRDRKSIGKRSTPLTPPKELNYDLWLGPAQDVPIFREQLHYDWHWDWNTGNGDVGNQGPHELDMIAWALKDPGMPREILSIGGRYVWDDGGNTPNVLATFFRFENDIPVCFEVRNIVPEPRTGYHGLSTTGVVITTDEGELRSQRGGAVFVDPDGKEVKKFKGDGGAAHQANFIDALRAGTNKNLRAEVERNHFASAIAHLANVSVRTGRTGTMSEAKAIADKLPGLSEHVENIATNLAKHGVDLSQPKLGLGAMLIFDPAKEVVTGEHATAAAPLLTREYRKGYELPELG